MANDVEGDSDVPLDDDSDLELDPDLDRVRPGSETDDFADRLRLAGVALVVLGVLIAVYIVYAHTV